MFDPVEMAWLPLPDGDFRARVEAVSGAASDSCVAIIDFATHRLTDRETLLLSRKLVKLLSEGADVAAFARQWRAERQREQQTTGRGTFIPLAFRSGEAFQFDWSEDYAVVGGDRMKLQVAPPALRPN